MQIHFGLESIRAEWTRSIACVGAFDGVHLGHCAVIGAAVGQARERELPCVLLTFDRHPAAILAPEKCPKAISPLQENLDQFSRLGVSIAVVIPFDAALSRMSATAFLDAILMGALKASALVVGHDFAMGHGREGDTGWLQQRIPTTVIPPFEIMGQRVSSSGIRAAVEAGDLDQASQLMGRHWSISGVVVSGERLGRQIGFPTANIARSADLVLPLDGIYAGWMNTPGGRFMAAASIGFRPTVNGRRRTIEAFLIDYPGESLYGKSVNLELCHWLRKEERFADIDELTVQVRADVERTRLVLAAS